MLKKILSKKDYRQLRLIEYFFEKKICTIRELQELITVQNITLQKDIKDINDYINPCYISKNERNDFSLYIPKNYAKNSLYRFVIAKSLEFKIIERTFFYTYGSFHSLAEALFISESTIRRMVKRINQVLVEENWQVQINNQAMLVGDIKKQIQLITYLILDKYECVEDFFQNHQIEYSIKIIQLFFEKNTDFFSYSQLTYTEMQKLIVHILVVMHLRKTNEKGYSKAPKAFELLELTAEIDKNNFLLKNRLTETDLANIFIHYIDCTKPDSCNALELLNRDQQMHEVINCLSQTIDAISNELKFPCINKERVIFSLINELIIAEPDQSLIQNKEKDFLNMLPTTYQMLAPFFENFVQTMKNKGSQIDICFCEMSLISYWHGLERELFEREKKLLRDFFLIISLKIQKVSKIVLNTT